MSIVFVTTRGNFVVDLFLKLSPMNCFNLLKLCKINWFKNSIFHEVIADFFVRIKHVNQDEGTTIYSLISDRKIYCKDEITKGLTHSKAGYLSTCNSGKDKNTSEFIITLGRDLSRFDSIRTIFGVVAEGFDVIKSLQFENLDANKRPIRLIRILETRIIRDPFDDPVGFDKVLLTFRPFERIKELDRVEDDEELVVVDVEEQIRAFKETQMKHNREILYLLGDIPDVNIHPPETTLFICKLHPRTDEEGLNIVFSKFGTVNNLSIIRDKYTGNSLCYGFIEFSKKAEAEKAYLRLQNAVIDNRKVVIDFCQSVRGFNCKNEVKR